MFNRKYIFQGSVCYCYVSLPECFCFFGGSDFLTDFQLQTPAAGSGHSYDHWLLMVVEGRHLWRKSGQGQMCRMYGISTYMNGLNWHEWLKLMFFLWEYKYSYTWSKWDSVFIHPLSLSLCLSQSTCTSLESKSFPWPFQADIRSGVRLEVIVTIRDRKLVYFTFLRDVNHLLVQGL